MKKQKILAIALGITFAVTSLVGGSAQAFANEKKASLQNVVCESEGTYEDVLYQSEGAFDINQFANDYVKKGIITQEEANKLIDAEKKLDKIFEKYEKATEEEAKKLDAEANKLFDITGNIYGKIFASEFYAELEEKKILTKEEIEQYKKVEKEIDKLWEENDREGLTDAQLDKLFMEQQKIYDKNKALFDKIDKYYNDIENEIWENIEIEDGPVEAIPY